VRPIGNDASETEAEGVEELSRQEGNEEDREDERSADEMKRIEATAYHEAGHAVCSLALGKAFKLVTIAPEGNLLGYCKGVVYRGGQRLEMDVYERNNRARDWIEKSVKVSLGGNVAERIFTGRNNFAGARGDFSNACDLLSHLCGYGNGEIEAYFNLLMIRTRDILTTPRNWLAVERLAAELLDKRTVRYKAAKAIANQAREDFFKLPNEKQQQMCADAQAYRQNWGAKKGGAAK
jgi:hypothetical protein